MCFSCKVFQNYIFLTIISFLLVVVSAIQMSDICLHISDRSKGTNAVRNKRKVWVVNGTNTVQSVKAIQVQSIPITDRITP